MWKHAEVSGVTSNERAHGKNCMMVSPPPQAHMSFLFEELISGNFHALGSVSFFILITP
jgi:hypothetical protein